MMNEQIYNELINPFFCREPKYIGVEIETILFSPSGKTNNKECADLVFKKMINEQNFFIEIMGDDGYIVRISNGKDAISCDYSYQLLEFSFGKDINISNISKRFSRYYEFMRPIFSELGFIFTGMATNHFRLPFNDDGQYTHDHFYTQVRKYVLEQSSYKDPSYFYTLMASAQSHIEVKGEELIHIYNLFNRLDFIRALLFSNSIPNNNIKQDYVKYPDNLICARDYLWDNQALPNTGIVEKDFSSLNDLADYISQQYIFVDTSSGSPQVIKPVKVEDFLRQGNNTSTYRSFEHVVINQYHVIEVRSDCTQPLCDTFAPLAFNVGIANNWEAALGVLKKFYYESGLPENNLLLRKMAITQQINMNNALVKKLLNDIVKLAEEGLKKRNFGEEKYLQCLYERIEKGTNPAINTLHELSKGISIDKIAQQYSEIHKSTSDLNVLCSI